MSILDFFPGKPRDGQIEVLEFLEENFDKYNVFAVRAPVASGKSRIGYTTAAWQAHQGTQSALVTPNNLLVAQYEGEFTDLPVLHRRSRYASPSDFALARRDAANSQAVLANYYTYVSNRLFRELLIVDEAHNVLPMLQERYATKLWQHQWGYPDDVATVEDFVEWAEQANNDKLNEIVRAVVHDQTFVLQRTTEDYRGKQRPVINLKPVTVRDQKPWLWPREVRKIVLMSATLSEYELYELGLDRRRVAYVEIDSPIPAANRPVVATPVANMAFDSKEYAVPKQAAWLKQMLDARPGRGLIHATYDVARQLRAAGLSHPRLMWHSSDNRQRVYEDWRNDGADKVLVASGMSEGIDLAYDLARWQVICQVPFPFLGDAAIAAKAARQPQWFAWEAVKTLVQTIGRVSRAPDDYGLTDIIDAQFPAFYRRSEQLWPQHVKNSVRIINDFDASSSATV